MMKTRIFFPFLNLDISFLQCFLQYLALYKTSNCGLSWWYDKCSFSLERWLRTALLMRRQAGNASEAPRVILFIFYVSRFWDLQPVPLETWGLAIDGAPHPGQRPTLTVGCRSLVMNPVANGCRKFKGCYLVFVYFVKIRFQRKSKGTVWNSQSLQFHGEHRSLPRGCHGLIISLFIVGCWWNLRYLRSAILLLLFWQFVKIKWLNQINMLSCSLTSAFHVCRFYSFWRQSDQDEPQQWQRGAFLASETLRR